MPLVKIDFANAPRFEPIPAGTVQGQTKKWELKETKDGESEYVLASFEVEVEIETEEGYKTSRRTLFCNWSLKPQALWRLKRDLIAMGADPADFESDDVDLEAILNDMFARPMAVELDVEVEEYKPPTGQARKQNRVTAVRNPMVEAVA